jgi:hypothetical protein
MSTLFDEVASPEGQGDDQKESRFGGADRKRLIVLGAVGGLAIVAAGGYFLLGSGSGDDSSASGPVVTHHATSHKAAASATPSTKPKASASPSSVPTVSGALATGRDPFAPLVVAPVATSSPSASPSPGSSDGTSDGGSTANGGATDSTDGSSASSSPSTTTTSANGTFVLNKLDYDEHLVWHADVTWNGKEYQPTLGSSFAGSFTFVAESNGYASFKNGNESFSLSVGGSKKF